MAPLPPPGYAYAYADFFSHSMKIPGLLEYGYGDMWEYVFVAKVYFWLLSEH